jgi:peptidoglycan/xylan/chitin deacetylase (PgdA/CDA1 family)
VRTVVPALTVVMYHYVRPIAASRHPRIKGLELDAFERQLDYLGRHHAFVTAHEVIEAARGNAQLPPNPVLLTFDDGYRDHHVHVFPILVRRGIRGAFFPPSSAALERRMLDVNRVHFVLATVEDASEVVRVVEAHVDERRRELRLASLDEYRLRYAQASRFDPAPVIYVKRMLQRALPEELRHAIADALFRRFVTSDEKGFVDELYLDVDDLREMAAAGMEIGSHGHSHRWLDSLDATKQRADIEHSLGLLDAIGVPRRDFLFCYPYGSYDTRTLDVLGELGCGAAFTTRVAIARPEAASLLELPRLDTNDLPVDAAASACEWTLQALDQRSGVRNGKELA